MKETEQEAIRWTPSTILATAALIVALIACAIGGVALNEAGNAGDVQTMGVTNLSSLTLADDLVVGGTTTQTGAVTQSGSFAADGGITVDTTAFTVADTSGNVGTAGTLIVAGVTTLNNNATVTGTLQYGADSLYPVGYASSGQQIVYGTASMTGTLSVSHGLTTVTFCVATLGEDPTAGAGDAAHVSVVVSANACTIKAWQDDFVTAATETDVAIQWLVIGAP